MARFDFTDKVVLVAGASRGIGEAIAHGFAEQGAIVICTSRKLEACEKVADEIRAKGLRASAKILHLGEIDTHQAVVDEIVAEHGRIDVLINNGATNPYMGPAHQAEERAFDKTFEVNVKGPYFLSSKCIEIMLENGGGSIVNVASIDGIHPGVLRAIYGMTKAAVINMTKGMAKEYGQHGIRVNALLPGFTDTKLAAALKDNPVMETYMNMNLAIKRMAQPEEMVGAVLYMASDEASYFTGQGMVVDGGAVI